MGDLAVMDVEESGFDAAEFADYWDSIQSDVEFGIEFMSQKVIDDSGRGLLASTASILAQRHGVSSDKIKTFRMSMRKACEKAGIDDIWSPKKAKGTGTAANPTPFMTLVPVIPHTKPAKSPQDLVYDRLLKGIKKGEYGLRDVELAVCGLNELEHETGIDLN